MDRRALAQEFRVGGDVELDPLAGIALERFPDPFPRLDGNRAFGDDQTIFPQMFRDDPRHVLDRRKVRASVRKRRCVHANKEHFATVHHLRDLRREAQMPGCDGLRDDLMQAGLVEKHLAGLEGADLLRIVIDTDDFMAEACKAPRHETNVPGAYNS